MGIDLKGKTVQELQELNAPLLEKIYSRTAFTEEEEKLHKAILEAANELLNAQRVRDYKEWNANR